MKNSIKILSILFMMNICLSLMINKAEGQGGYVSFQVFYDNLSPYGQWVDYPNTGYVWVPNVDAGFSPYGSNGHWVMTEYGWTWVSGYPWGWAPFHYGRWNFDPYYGWVWCPDNVWGPAWVSWRRSEGYYGWAPMRPGITLEISFGRDYREDDERYVFVRDRDFDREDVYNRYEPRTNNTTIIRNTTIINNTYIDNSRHVTYVAGPERNDVQKRTGKAVQLVKVRDSDKPGENVNKQELAIYRPQVQRITESTDRPAPKSVATPADIKHIGKRDNVNQQKQTPPPNNTQEKKVTPAQQNPVKENINEQKKNVPVTPQLKKDVPVQQNQPKAKPNDQKKDIPVTPQLKKDVPVQQNTPKGNPNEQKKDIPVVPQQKKDVPVQQTPKKGNVDKPKAPTPDKTIKKQNVPKNVAPKAKDVPQPKQNENIQTPKEKNNDQ